MKLKNYKMFNLQSVFSASALLVGCGTEDRQ